MKAILVHEFGWPEVLKLGDVPTPRPAAGQACANSRCRHEPAIARRAFIAIGADHRRADDPIYRILRCFETCRIFSMLRRSDGDTDELRSGHSTALGHVSLKEFGIEKIAEVLIKKLTR
jgi:hypothetical protein